MECKIKPLVERYSLLSCIEENGPHAPDPSLFVCEIDQCAPRTRVPAGLVNDQIINMQVRAASQGMDGSHAHYSYDALSVEGANQFITREGLALDTPQELFLGKLTKLGNDRKSRAPLGGGQTPDSQCNHRVVSRFVKGDGNSTGCLCFNGGPWSTLEVAATRRQRLSWGR